jgi:ABC-2 type transport system permease protein
MRKKRILFMGLLVLLPALLPVAVALLRPPHSSAPWGLDLFALVAEYGFLGTLAPLTAILLGTALVGDDLENGTAPYLLTRATPRSALVVGKFAAYVLVTAAAFLPAMALTFAGAVLTAPGPVNLGAGALLFGQTFFVVSLALVVYGALCGMLGTLTKRPVIYSVMFVFGWEPLTQVVPGYVDFLTVKKHLLALWPVVTTSLDRSVDFTRKVIDVGIGEASLLLIVVVVALAAITTLTLRKKEFVRGANLA